MAKFGVCSSHGVEELGLKHLADEFWNFSPAELVEDAIANGEATLSSEGAIIAYTGKHTGRSPNDKYVVERPELADKPMWWGKVNPPMSPEIFEKIYEKMMAYYQGRQAYIKDLYVGADPNYSVPIRVITEKAWHNLFAHNLFRRLDDEQLKDHKPEFTVIQAEDFKVDPAKDGTRSETAIILDLVKKVILVCGSGYAGEIKKSIFTVMNYLLPQKGVLSMHCSANVGQKGDSALFFGLSGTGKTTLSSDPLRKLIGDDEHGWSDEGIFNFEGGCYAKTIKLSPVYEPIIWSAVNRFGAVLENVPYDEVNHKVDFDSDEVTENTRGAYPLTFIADHVPSAQAGHPENVFFLTADAFGVLPPISRLDKEQAMFYFLSGYTAKLAGTEAGMGSEPEATFSTCFGAPFLPLKPNIYAKLLGEKIEKHNAKVWLINTGWTGGAYGVGSRMKLPYTRATITAAINKDFDNIEFVKEPYFGLEIPVSCPDVPSEMLNPAKSWKDQDAYAKAATNLKARFDKNYEQYK